MTLLVTGASGWLGREVAAAARADHDDVVGLVATAAEAEALALDQPGLDVRIADLRRPDAVRSAVSGLELDAVIHTAGIIHPHRVEDWTEVNVEGLARLLDVVAGPGLRAFVQVSSNSVLGVNADEQDRFGDDEPPRPWLGYGRSKAAAESLLHERLDEGTTVTVLRPPWFYGPGQPERQARFISAVRRGRFPLVSPGTQRRSMAYVPDLAAACLRALHRSDGTSRTWWWSDPRPYSLEEILQTVRAAARLEGLEVSGALRRMPAAAAMLAERADAALQRRGRYVSELHVLGELGRTIAGDPTAGRAALLPGVEPPGLLAGWRAAIRWAIDHGQEV